MPDDEVVGLLILLARVDLLVNGPGEGLSHQVLELGDPADVGILGVVGENHADEVLFGEYLEEVVKLSHHLEVILVFLGQARKQAAEAIDHDQLQVHVEASLLDSREDLGEQ